MESGIGETIELPEEIGVCYNDPSVSGTMKVEWSEEDLAVIDVDTGNLYTVTGTLENGAEVTFQIKDDPVFGGTVFATGGFDAMGNTISNVADGVEDTDAVNVRQLREATQSADLAVLYDDSKKTTVTLNPGGSATKITNLAKGKVSEDSSDAVNGSQLYGLSKSAADIFGGTTVVDNEGNLSGFSFTNYEGDEFADVSSVLKATDSDLKRLNETFDVKSYANRVTVKKEAVFNENVTMNKDLTVSGTFTANGPAVFNDTVTMNKGLNVSGGPLNMNGNQIKGLRPGTDEGDAATYGQVRSVSDRVDSLATNMDHNIRRTGAHAAALAGLQPLPYNPAHRTQATFGVGFYQGETSVALGISHYFNENARMNIGSTVGTKPMANVGFAFNLGRGEEPVKAERRARVAQENRIAQLEARLAQLEQKTGFVPPPPPTPKAKSLDEQLQEILNKRRIKK